VSVLAHYLERAGLASVIISLVRLHSDKIRPPRTLFVPFELGRPLGEPNNAPLQRDILGHALALLGNDSPPPIFSRYIDMRSVDLSHPWQAPDKLTAGRDESLSFRALEDELKVVLNARTGKGRGTEGSAFGNAGLSTEDCARSFVALVRNEQDPANPINSKTARFVVDDIKTLYVEAATRDTARVPSPALGNWFWRETQAALGIVRFRTHCT